MGVRGTGVDSSASKSPSGSWGDARKGLLGESRSGFGVVGGDGVTTTALLVVAITGIVVAFLRCEGGGETGAASSVELCRCKRRYRRGAGEVNLAGFGAEDEDDGAAAEDFPLALDGPIQNASSSSSGIVASPVRRFLFPTTRFSASSPPSLAVLSPESLSHEPLERPVLRLWWVRGGVGRDAVEAERFNGRGMGGNATGDESSMALRLYGLIDEV